MEGIEQPPEINETIMDKVWENNLKSNDYSTDYWERMAAKSRAQDEADNAAIDAQDDLELAHSVAGEARDSGGQWTTGSTKKKQARQAYVAGRMQHDAMTAPGLVTAGNINLMNRPRIQNADGSVSTVRSMSVNIGGKEVLIPTVSAIQNRVLTDDEAIAEYQQTGQHLGVFNSPQAATQYANRLHKHQEEFYSD